MADNPIRIAVEKSKLEEIEAGLTRMANPLVHYDSNPETLLKRVIAEQTENAKLTLKIVRNIQHQQYFNIVADKVD